jgi:CRISPR-associated protein Cpf1
LVKGSNEFYTSEYEKKKGKHKNGRWISKLPVDADADADANGAYNIARKGLWLLGQLDKEDDNEKAIKFFEGIKKPKEITAKEINDNEE